MDLEKIKDHWDKLSGQYAKDLKSTTKTPTIKKLEINALIRSIEKIEELNYNFSKILEVGCGNGYNLIGLSQNFPDKLFHGVDYSEGMIENAIKLKKENSMENVEYFIEDILKINENNYLHNEYDLVFTNRCIINLNNHKIQLEALSSLSHIVSTGGYLLLIENSNKTYYNQNQCRNALGMESRVPDEYNCFINETDFIKYAKIDLNLNLIDVIDFASLHDILLYVILPKINNGKVDYRHPLMDVVTELILNLDINFANQFGSFGQNRLFIFKK